MSVVSIPQYWRPAHIRHAGYFYVDSMLCVHWVFMYHVNLKLANKTFAERQLKGCYFSYYDVPSPVQILNLFVNALQLCEVFWRPCKITLELHQMRACIFKWVTFFLFKYIFNDCWKCDSIVHASPTLVCFPLFQHCSIWG